MRPQGQIVRRQGTDGLCHYGLLICVSGPLGPDENAAFLLGETYGETRISRSCPGMPEGRGRHHSRFSSPQTTRGITHARRLQKRSPHHVHSARLRSKSSCAASRHAENDSCAVSGLIFAVNVCISWRTSAAKGNRSPRANRTGRACDKLVKL